MTAKPESVALRWKKRLALCGVALASVHVTPAATTSSAASWREVDPGTPTLFDAMAYDEARQQLVLFGGDAYNTTWIWNGSGWTKLNRPTSPGQRLGARMAYDPNTKTVILFGGNDLTTGLLNETWSWNGTTWTQLHPAHAPSARFAPGLACDAAENKLVLFGGYGAAAVPQGDTWTWDGTDWTQQLTAVGPSPRFWPGMAYDPDTSSVVLFGGTTPYENVVLNDTWTWSAAGWSLHTPTNSPPGRGYMDLAYSPVSHKMVLFGGVSFAPVAPATVRDGLTWEWDGTNWSSRQITPGPGPRFYNSSALNKASGNIVLQGGLNFGDPPFGETWIWNGSTWSQAATPAPGKRANASLALDTRRKEMVLFGGLSILDSYLADTWTWDGKRWTSHQPSISPTGRVDAALAEDPANGNVVLFGGQDAAGYSNQTWIWNGVDWILQNPMTSPPARSGAAMHYDTQSGRIILLGGTNGAVLNDTWAWNGQNWIQLNPATSPSARQAAGFTRDGNGHLVLFGGALASGVASDTWTWEGTNWIQQSPALSPPACQFARLAYSQQIGAVILFGGIGGTGALLSDTWKWNGTTWSAVSSSVNPGARYRHVLAEGPDGDVVLFGDIDRNDTWSLGVPPVQLSAVVSRKTHGSAGTFDIDLPLTGPPGIECRTAGVSGDYTLVFTFANTLTNVAGVSVSSSTGSVTSGNIDSNDAHNYIATLTGVTNAQVITVGLTNVSDSAGDFSSAVSRSMGVLLGDVNGSGGVSNTDVASVKSQVAASVTASNFRSDVNANGVISNSDVATVKAQVGTTLP
jgi:hypothetical protein